MESFRRVTSARAGAALALACAGLVAAAPAGAQGAHGAHGAAKAGSAKKHAGAAKKHKQQPGGTVKVTGGDWQVGESGESLKAPAGGSVSYCPSTGVESLTPVISVHASKSGEHEISERVIGPAGVGGSSLYTKRFTETATLLELRFPAAAFNGLTRTTNTANFRPGVYKLQVEGLTGKKAQTVESVKLVAKSGC